MILKNASAMTDWDVAETLARLPFSGSTDYTIIVRTSGRCISFGETRFDIGRIRISLPPPGRFPYYWYANPKHVVRTQREALLYLAAHELFHIRVVATQVSTRRHGWQRTLTAEQEEMAADDYAMRMVVALRKSRGRR
jgi:hypothetical protein